MSFEKFLDADILQPSFNRTRFVKNYKERQNISKARLDSESGCMYAYVGDIHKYAHDEALGTRYVGCLELVYDLVMSIYDVNSKTLLLFRFNAYGPDTDARLDAILKTIKNPNFEARLIGLQHNQFYNILISAFNYLKKRNIPLVEVDLFGNEKRHVAFDVKTGISFDVLVENRPYKPAELTQAATPEQFQRSARPPQAQRGPPSKGKMPR